MVCVAEKTIPVMGRFGLPPSLFDVGTVKRLLVCACVCGSGGVDTLSCLNASPLTFNVSAKVGVGPLKPEPASMRYPEDKLRWNQLVISSVFQHSESAISNGWRNIIQKFSWYTCFWCLKWLRLPWLFLFSRVRGSAAVRALMLVCARASADRRITHGG